MRAAILILPGLAVAALTALGAWALSKALGTPFTMTALVTGLALNFLQKRERLAPGLAFAAGTLLRISIVILGLRITIGEVAALGPLALGALILIVAATIGAALLLARLLGQSLAFGALAGGAVGICGASAALAVAALLGERRVSQAQLAMVLVGMSAMSALSMIVYPLLAGEAGLGDAQAGFLLGAAIHEVAHSLGAGYAFSAGAGEVATIVKMSRVALLAPVLLVLGLAFGGGARGALRLPWFVVGFFTVAALTSLGLFSSAVRALGADAAAWLLAAAVAATGIRLPLRKLAETGFRPLLVLGGASLTALILVLLAILFLL